MTNIHSLEPSDLSLHGAWIRALARRLVRDDAAADDLVQETWLAALQRGPTRDRPLRPWLARVARNLAAKRLARGQVRAHDALPIDAQGRAATPEETAETLEQQQLLIQLVSALPEPERTTLVLRYTHGLTSPEIARRQGVPAGTVRWRLKRAVDLLREELDLRNDGERRAWSLALLPLFERQEAALAGAQVGAGSSLASMLATVPSWVGGAVAAAVALALVMFWIAERVAAPESAVPAAIAPLARGGPDADVPAGHSLTRDSRLTTSGGRVAAGGEPRPAVKAVDEVAGPPNTPQLSGTVRDATGRAVGPGWLKLVRIDGPGDFELPLDRRGAWSISKVTPGHYYIGAEQLPNGYLPAWNQYRRRVSTNYSLNDPTRGRPGPAFTPDYGGTDIVVRPDAVQHGLELMVYRPGAVRGTVRSVDGTTIANTPVRLRGFDTGFVNMVVDGTTDEHGDFEVDDVWPGNYEVVVYGNGQGGRALTQSSFPIVGVVSEGVHHVDVWLGEGTAQVSGIVLDEFGAPFANLQVLVYRSGSSWGDRIGLVTTDAAGRFTVAGIPPGSFSLTVGHGAFRVGTIREDHTARLVEPVLFEIERPGQSVQLDPIEAIRSAPFILRGQVNLSQLAEPGLRPGGLRVIARWSYVPQLSQDGGLREAAEPIDVANDGSFSWWCETPHEDIQLVVSDAAGRYADRTFHVAPERGAEREITITFP
jgi:RNA polymerase sigma-70 factor (ECF subfamily)